MHPRKSGQMPPFQGAEIEKQADGTGDHLWHREGKPCVVQADEGEQPEEGDQAE